MLVDDYYLRAEIRFPAGTAYKKVDREILRLAQVANEIRTELNAALYSDASRENGDSIRHVLTLSDDNRGFVNLELTVDECVRARARVEDIRK